MARVPTIAEEDAKRPNRERECLVGERTRIANRMKATLARLGIRNFKPTLRKAAERLATLHTAEGVPLPPNVSAQLQRDMARLGFVTSQIRDIEGGPRRSLSRLRAAIVGEFWGELLDCFYCLSLWVSLPVALLIGVSWPERLVASTLVFAAAMGMLWLSVAPLVSGLVAEMFGTRYMATLLGISFVMHQVGSSLGAFGGGLIFDLTGSYDGAWKIGVLIGFTAGVVQIVAGGPARRPDPTPEPRLAPT